MRWVNSSTKCPDLLFKGDLLFMGEIAEGLAGGKESQL